MKPKIAVLFFRIAALYYLLIGFLAVITGLNFAGNFWLPIRDYVLLPFQLLITGGLYIGLVPGRAVGIFLNGIGFPNGTDVNGPFPPIVTITLLILGISSTILSITSLFSLRKKTLEASGIRFQYALLGLALIIAIDNIFFTFISTPLLWLSSLIWPLLFFGMITSWRRTMGDRDKTGIHIQVPKYLVLFIILIFASGLLMYQKFVVVPAIEQQGKAQNLAFERRRQTEFDEKKLYQERLEAEYEKRILTTNTLLLQLAEFIEKGEMDSAARLFREGPQFPQPWPILDELRRADPGKRRKIADELRHSQEYNTEPYYAYKSFKMLRKSDDGLISEVHIYLDDYDGTWYIISWHSKSVSDE